MIMIDKKKRLAEIKKILKIKTKEHHKDTKSLIEERNKIEEQINKAELEKYVGRCFKFRNSHGSGDKWWLYYKVISIAEFRDVKVITIQDVPDSNLEMNIQTIHSGMLQQEIPCHEFDEVFKKSMAKFRRKGK